MTGGGPPSKDLFTAVTERVDAEGELGIDGGSSRASFRSNEKASLGGSKGPSRRLSAWASLSAGHSKR